MIGILIPLLLIQTPAKAHMGHSFPTGEWIQDMRNWKSERERISIEDSIGNALDELEWIEEE